VTSSLSQREVLFLSVADLTASDKILNMLDALDLKYVGQVLAQPRERFMSIRGVGERTVSALVTLMNNQGLRLGDSPQEWAELASSEFESQYAKEIRRARRAHATQDVRVESIEADIARLLRDVKVERDRAIIRSRYGWAGGAPRTLQEVADEFGPLTRERVRQICDRFEERLSRRRVHIPCVKRALKVIEDALPATEDTLISAISRAGIDNKCSIDGLVNSARLAGMKTSVEKANAPFDDIWVREGASELAKQAASIARRQMSAQGAATLEQIADELQREFGYEVEADGIAAVVSRQEKFVRFDEYPGWFWFETPRNRLINVLKKIFAVAKRLDVSEVRSAVQRFRRFDGFAPPQRVLVGLANVLPEFTVDENVISRAEGVSTDDWIEGTEAIIAKVMREAGGILDRISLSNKCIALGRNEITFNIYLHATPILQNLGKGVFALIGNSFDENAIAQHQLAGGIKPIVDYGWKSDGRLRISYRVTEHMRYTGFFPIPAQIAEYIGVGEYKFVDGEKVDIGLLKTSKSQAWGLKSLFRRVGGEPGDLFDLSFDLTGKVAEVGFGVSLEAQRQPVQERA
jgi:hypothetical protein